MFRWPCSVRGISLRVVLVSPRQRGQAAVGGVAVGRRQRCTTRAVAAQRQHCLAAARVLRRSGLCTLSSDALLASYLTPFFSHDKKAHNAEIQIGILAVSHALFTVRFEYPRVSSVLLPAQAQLNCSRQQFRHFRVNNSNSRESIPSYTEASVRDAAGGAGRGRGAAARAAGGGELIALFERALAPLGKETGTNGYLAGLNGADEQAGVPFHHISELEMHGVNRQDITRLTDAGFCTVESVRQLRMGTARKQWLKALIRLHMCSMFDFRLPTRRSGSSPRSRVSPSRRRRSSRTSPTRSCPWASPPPLSSSSSARTSSPCPLDRKSSTSSLQVRSFFPVTQNHSLRSADRIRKTQAALRPALSLSCSASSEPARRSCATRCA